MNECPFCGAHREWKATRDAVQSQKQKFLSHPKGGCREYIDDKLKNRCNLFDQDFGTPRACKEDCDSQIYCFETQIGSTTNQIYFDTPGPPWVKHDCRIKPTLVVQLAEYKPCVIDACVSCQRFLGFTIQIKTDGFRQKTLIAIQRREDKQQIVRQLHQPFFYKEISHQIWILNTYQDNCDVNGRLLCVPKEYNCVKVDHESLKRWKTIFGDEKQRSLDF
jgi:hypothetical protein